MKCWHNYFLQYSVLTFQYLVAQNIIAVLTCLCHAYHGWFQQFVVFVFCGSVLNPVCTNIATLCSVL